MILFIITLFKYKFNILNITQFSIPNYYVFPPTFVLPFLSSIFCPYCVDQSSLLAAADPSYSLTPP